MKPFKAIILFAVLPFTYFSSRAQNAVIPCPQNMIVSAEKGKEGAVVLYPASPEFSNVNYTPSSGSFLRLGSHSIIMTNAAGQKCSFTVTVTDNEAPELSSITLSRERLWPASNKMKKVVVRYEASDNSGTVKTALSVTSNATDGIKDWEIIDDHLIRLKSSRLPEDKARIYQVTVTATDDAGNKTKRTTSIAVSRTMVAVSSN